MTISDMRPAATFAELSSAMTGSVVTAGDADWNSARAAWNLAVDQSPAAVAKPHNAADVAAIVLFAAAHGLRVTAQGTGHHAGTIGELADTILIRTSALTGIEVDPVAARVRIGSGVVWGQLSAVLGAHGLAGLAGSSADVGVVGYCLGGGYSWLGREHGLASSSVTAIELVTADGTVRSTDAEREPDLFWALRGGGGNFGVVTAMELETVPLPDVYAGMMLYPLDRAADVLSVFERVASTLDERATLCARLLHLPPMPDLPEFLRGKAFAAIDGAVNAPDDEAEIILRPFTELGPTTNTFARIPAAALSQVHMDPTQPVPAGGNGMVLDDLPDGAIDALLDAAGTGVPTPLLLVDVRLLGGAYARQDPRGGALASVPGRFLINAIGIAPTPEAAAAIEAATHTLLASIEPWRSEFDYSNFRETAEPASVFFGDEVLSRLRAVKAQYDPANLIRGCHDVS
jgi:hypothetical protein